MRNFHLFLNHVGLFFQCTLILFLVTFFRCTLTENSDSYSGNFAVKIPGGSSKAQEIAEKHGYTYLGPVFEDFYHFEHKSIVKRSSEPSYEHHHKLNEESEVEWFEQQKVKSRVKRNAQSVNFRDPQWPQTWYLNRGHGKDMNVEAAWEAGITGLDVVITILDDGLEKDHPDLKANYDAEASYDVNQNDSDPQPRYDMTDSNRHGTRCAGEIAAKSDNDICSVGVAYGSKVGGVRMLDGEVTDVVEAKSLSINPQHVDIYSASWGPDDDGRTVDGPGKLATKAFINGILKGRHGLGSIFVWASGNGGRNEDNCNCDGYTNSIWTLSISSATENGLVPWYSEACSSSLATTYSSGSNGERQVITTDLHHGCTSKHTGTSASAPLAAGICALALQANRNLTWRDMQHIVVRTARPVNLYAKDWAVNGVGRKVSHSFGYGLMDAGAMVKLAKTWKAVSQAKVCEVRAHHLDKIIPAKSHVELTLEVNSCEHVNYLEHVQAKITLGTTRRGDIRIYLISPRGTRSTLLALRRHDSSQAGFAAWPFMTVHNWGENPKGKWKLEIHNEGRYFGRAKLNEWSLILYGTETDPDERQVSPATPTKSSKVPVFEATKQPTTSKEFLPTSVETTTKTIPSTTAKDDRIPSSTTINPMTENSIKASIMDWSHLQYGDTNSVGNVSAESCSLHSNGQCLGCDRPYRLHFGMCVWKCPINHYATKSTGKHGLAVGLVCQPCHYSCKACDGPRDSQCSECYGDGVIYSGYCYSKEAVRELNDGHRWQTISIIIYISLFFIIFTLIVYIFCEKLSARKSSPPKYSQLKNIKNGGCGVVLNDDSSDDI